MSIALYNAVWLLPKTFRLIGSLSDCDIVYGNICWQIYITRFPIFLLNITAFVICTEQNHFTKDCLWLKCSFIRQTSVKDLDISVRIDSNVKLLIIRQTSVRLKDILTFFRYFDIPVQVWQNCLNCVVCFQWLVLHFYRIFCGEEWQCMLPTDRWSHHSKSNTGFVTLEIDWDFVNTKVTRFLRKYRIDYLNEGNK